MPRPRLTLKVGRAGANVRVDRDLERVPTQDELERAADAAAEALGLPPMRADRRGSKARPTNERVGPPTKEE